MLLGLAEAQLAKALAGEAISTLVEEVAGAFLRDEQSERKGSPWMEDTPRLCGEYSKPLFGFLLNKQDSMESKSCVFFFVAQMGPIFLPFV